MAEAKLVTVYGTEKSNLATGKLYKVTEKLAETLIKKGAASKTAPKGVKNVEES